MNLFAINTLWIQTRYNYFNDNSIIIHLKDWTWIHFVIAIIAIIVAIIIVHYHLIVTIHRCPATETWLFSSKIVDIIDSSGVRLLYSPSIRQNDVGNLPLGDVPGIFIPPNSSRFRLVAYCHSSCTEKVGFSSSFRQTDRQIALAWFPTRL